jgi:hypothetical protein
MGLMDKEEDSKPFDKFELLTAILLGLAAIGAALAAQQGGQWGGKQLEAFSAANTLTTKAATQYTEDTVDINADYAAVAAAKDHILQARDADSPKDRERHLDMASYQYTNQMSELGYKAMGLPLDYYVEDEDDKAESAAPAAAVEKPAVQPAAVKSEEEPAAAGADAEAEDETPETAETTAATALERDLPDEVLVGTLKQELDEEYVDKALAKGTQMFADADKRFEEGRTANENGDKFDLVGVFYTVALFFAGLGLVFKSTAKWGFFAAGMVIFLGASVYLAMLPWTG